MKNIFKSLLKATPNKDLLNEEPQTPPWQNEEESTTTEANQKAKNSKIRVHQRPTANLLQAIYSITESFPHKFREKVCEECNWSTPTFYRKMRQENKSGVQGKNKKPQLSNAEMEKIVNVFDEVYTEAQENCKEYRKKIK